MKKEISLKERWKMDNVLWGFSQCYTCSYYDIDKDNCLAFDTIPQEIRENDFIHIKIYPTQSNQILYKEITKE